MSFLERFCPGLTRSSGHLETMIGTFPKNLHSQIDLFGSAPARPVGFCAHHNVHDLLGEAPEQLLHVDGAIIETGHVEHVRRRV